MSTLLVIEVSPRYESSTSRKLTSVFVEAWKASHPDGTVIMRDLMKTNLPFVDLAWIGGAFTSREQHSPESAAAIKVSDALVAELQAADQIVIGTPMFNFSRRCNCIARKCRASYRQESHHHPCNRR
jgi:FMN-dependent NADH-azoreductase